MPATELASFGQNIQYARDLAATATALQAQITSALSTDDLLRAALVQGVSAFDHFIHEEVRVRMLEIQSGVRVRPQGFSRFRVSLDSVHAAAIQSGSSWLENEIKEQHGYLSFQQPDKVADAIRLVSNVMLWPAVASHMKLPVHDAKRRLKLIVDRRNKIAHEADTDQTPPRSRYPISAPLITDSLDYLQNLVNAISVVV
ncbi:MAG: hypothetical protein WCF33_21555 [Pseudonocardiaceae bacterium]